LVRKNSFKSKLEHSISLESDLAEYYLQKSLKAENPVLKLVFRQLALDTMEHSDILETVRDMLSGRIPKSKERMRTKELEEHSKIEKELMLFYKEAERKAGEKEVKLLFQKLVSDEDRHHNMLETLIKTLRHRK